MKPVAIYCENNDNFYQFDPGTTLDEALQKIDIDKSGKIVGARVNNKIKDLSYTVYKPENIKFIDLHDPDGNRMYLRSLTFVLEKAVLDLFGKIKFKVKHSVANGLFCEVEGERFKLDSKTIESLKNKMESIVKDNIPFFRHEIQTEKAIKIFDDFGYTDKAELFRSRKNLYSSVYYLGNLPGYFYGHLVPSTSYLEVFDLMAYQDGILLMYPDTSDITKVKPFVKQDKMFNIFKEHKCNAKLLNVENVALVNKAIDNGCMKEIIKLSEALHEKKISQIADKIHDRKNCKLVLISGPSSSGKTTFSKRLSLQLRLLGYKPIEISLDDYFVNREFTPKDENGDYDFEDIKAIDTDLFNENLLKLMNNESVDMPRFNFSSGSREYKGDVIVPQEGNIFIVEGIHGLNPRLSTKIPEKNKFKIYVSALTQISVDNLNRIPTTDNRLLRRIVRDHNFRNNSALDTLKRWPSVRRGEEKNIFPYQEEADEMFNSSLLYELLVLKNAAVPLLKEIPEKEKEYAEAVRLLKFLSYFNFYDAKDIPPTSILKEFLGGSSFSY
ncbi:MAG: nucleoside kinase [Candidatus Delongbacteria bacterium]|nr:nucleoside kinase [Candidatus Delongbacteria bacterium]MBN2837006.1 nucleoside kinase [Candidatus Delongbacteria bacterium]